MVRYLIVVFALLAPALAHGTVFSGYFSNLENVKLKHTGLDSAYFHYKPNPTAILNTINEQMSREYGFQVLNVAKITLRREKEEITYLVTYDEGLPLGPNYKIHTIEGQDTRLIGKMAGINLYWRGRKIFYTSGHIHSMFDQRRKFVLEGDRVNEVVQPFQYVGLESELQESIILYSTKDSTVLENEVGHLPKGARVTVLIADGDFYLIKSTFGLVGWITIEKSRNDYIIKGLYYRDGGQHQNN